MSKFMEKGPIGHYTCAQAYNESRLQSKLQLSSGDVVTNMPQKSGKLQENLEAVI